MKRNVKQDSAFDHLIAETLAAQTAAGPTDACIDAETLAAWADDTLGSRERKVVEAHAADCARCQALMAAMVKTTPSPVVGASPWRFPAFRWLIPAAAVAAVAIVWVMVPGMGWRERPNVPLPVPAPLARPSPPVARADTSASSRGMPREMPREVPRQIPAQPAEQRSSAAASADKQEGVSAKSAVPATPAAAAPPAMAERNVVAGRLAAQAQAATPAIVSPDPSSRWRIVADGAVERSTDGGSTWQIQQTGVTATLTAGASPSPSVCWLVGPGGTVVVSTDGRSWRRLVFPEAASLTSVTATDDRRATVTTADGRSFRTTDGGATWMLV